MKMKVVRMRKQMRTGSGIKDLGIERRLVPACYATRANKDMQQAYEQYIVNCQTLKEAAELLRGEDDE